VTFYYDVAVSRADRTDHANRVLTVMTVCSVLRTGAGGFGQVRGAGMRNHSDSLMTASWHATLAGRKWWHLCSPRGDGECYETVAPRGGIVIYGTGTCTCTLAPNRRLGRGVVGPAVCLTASLRFV
jgi:hypothetical protein